jgi:hypothetical protein
MTQDRDPFEARCREVLAARVESVDGHASSRLNRARQAALAELAANRDSRPFRVPGLWLPGSVLAGAAVLALTVWIARPVGAPHAPLAEATPLEDAEMLSSSEGPDLYQDDADFYDWAGGDNAGGTG